MRAQLAANPSTKDQADSLPENVLEMVRLTVAPLNSVILQMIQHSRVDAVPLLNNKKEHDFIAVNMYVDDR